MTHIEAGFPRVTTDQVYGALRQCHDPEIPIDIVSLGLVYGITIVDDWVGVKMTLTTQGCGLADQIAENVKRQVRTIPGVQDCDVRLVWNPPWTPSRMSPHARAKLGL